MFIYEYLDGFAVQCRDTQMVSYIANQLERRAGARDPTAYPTHPTPLGGVRVGQPDIGCGRYDTPSENFLIIFKESRCRHET